MIFKRTHTLDRDMYDEKKWKMVVGGIFCEEHREPFTPTLEDLLAKRGKSLSAAKAMKWAFRRGSPADQFCAESLMRNQDKIPAEFQAFVLAFYGTAYKDKEGCLWYPIMVPFEDRWLMKFDHRDYSQGRSRAVMIG